MTTAARPTFDPARGGKGSYEGDLSAMTKQYSNRDLPGHTRLKYREEGQGAAEEMRGRDFRRELEDRERAARDKRDRDRGRESGHSKRPRLDQIPAANLDADDPVDEDSSSDDDDDEDETLALMAELQKIKKERAQDQAKVEIEKRQEEERIRTDMILRGNPLLGDTSAAPSDFSVKRRWDDDVVFKNCAKDEESKKTKGFINDSLRSEFHRKFMEKYVK